MISNNKNTSLCKNFSIFFLFLFWLHINCCGNYLNWENTIFTNIRVKHVIIMFRYYRRQSLDIKFFFFLYFMVCLFLQNHDHRFLAITNAVKTRFFNKQLIKMRYTDLSKPCSSK